MSFWSKFLAKSEPEDPNFCETWDIVLKRLIDDKYEYSDTDLGNVKFGDILVGFRIRDNLGKNLSMDHRPVCSNKTKKKLLDYITMNKYAETLEKYDPNKRRGL